MSTFDPEMRQPVVLVDASGEPETISVSLTGDVQIGAVEIKNDSDDTRLKIGGGAIANAARVTIGTDDTMVGALTETAPATDTASSGLNGRLQRIAQRLTSLIALIPASLGQKTMAASLAVTIASDQSAVKAELGPYLLGRVTADGQIKATAGFVHTVSIAPLTATPTAGLLTVYDSATETGTVIYSEWVFATAPGHTVTLDVPAGTAIYVGFDATLANVQVTVAYR